MKAKYLAVLLILGMSAAALAQTAPVQPMPGTAPIDQMNAAPPIFQIKDGVKPEKNYRQQPPLIPHRIEKYEIDLKVNMCLNCHDWPNNVQEHAPLVSPSHYLDRDGNKLDKVSSLRWFCVQCHVPQADAKPLVENRFTPANK